MVRILWCCRQKLDKDLTARVFYIEEIRVVIFTMSSHRKVLLNWQIVSVFIINLLDLGVGYSVILLNNHSLIMQEKSLFC